MKLTCSEKIFLACCFFVALFFVIRFTEARSERLAKEEPKPKPTPYSERLLRGSKIVHDIEALSPKTNIFGKGLFQVQAADQFTNHPKIVFPVPDEAWGKLSNDDKSLVYTYLRGAVQDAKEKPERYMYFKPQAEYREQAVYNLRNYLQDEAWGVIQLTKNTEGKWISLHESTFFSETGALNFEGNIK